MSRGGPAGWGSQGILGAWCHTPPKLGGQHPSLGDPQGGRWAGGSIEK